MPGLIGATILPAGGATVANIMAGYTGSTVITTPWNTLVTPAQSMKVYFNAGEFPNSSAYVTAAGQLGMRVYLCYKPLYSNIPHDLGALVTSIQAFQAQLAALGAPPPVVTLWQEPQNAGNFSPTNGAAQYLAVVASYANAIRAPYVAGVSCGLKLCYDGSAQDPSEAFAWFPGPPNTNPLTGLPFTAPLVDIVAADYYAGHYYSGKYLTNWLLIASGNGGLYPPLPFGLGEMGNAESDLVLSQETVTGYLSYIIDTMAPLAAVGLADACMWYQDDSGTLSGVNVIPNTVSELIPGDPSSDFRIPLLLALEAVLNPVFPVGGQPLMVPFFPAGYPPQASDFNTWIQAPFTFLTNKVVFRASLNTANLVLPTGQATLIPFDTVLEDPYSGWDAATSCWQCPAGMSGTYSVCLTASAQGSNDMVSTVQPIAALNGNLTATVNHAWQPANQIGVASGTVPLQLAGGQDQVSGYVWWNSNGEGTVSTLSGRRCTIEIIWQNL